MKGYHIFSLLLVVVCIFAVISGCIESDDKNNNELKETTKDESRQIAEDYVRDLDSYKTYNLTGPVLIEARALNCSFCWQFIYKFDLVSEKGPAIVNTATVTVKVIEGQVVDTVYAQGIRY